MLKPYCKWFLKRSIRKIKEMNKIVICFSLLFYVNIYSQLLLEETIIADIDIFSKHYYGANDLVKSYPLWIKPYPNSSRRFFELIFYNKTSDNYQIYLDTSESPYLNNDTSIKYDLNSNCNVVCLETFNYEVNKLEEELLPKYRPCTSGYVIGQFRNKRTNELTEVKKWIKLGPMERIIKWGIFNNINGRYHNKVLITNHNEKQYVYKPEVRSNCRDWLNIDLCKDADFYFEKTTINNAKLLSTSIVIKPHPDEVRWRTGEIGAYGVPLYDKGSFLLNMDKLVLKGDYKTPVVLTNTVLRAVNENYFLFPPLPDDDIEIIAQGQKSEEEIFSEDELILFPNPFKNELYIKTSHQIESWSISNFYKRTVKSGANTKINTEDLDKGMYIIDIVLKSGKKIKKKMIKD